VSGATYVVTTTESGDSGVQESAERWIDLMRTYHCEMGLQRPTPPQVRWRVSRQRTATYQLVTCTSSVINSERTALQIRRDPSDEYRLVVATRGNIGLRQDGVEVTLRPGSAMLVDVNSPFEYLIRPGTEQLVLNIPRREVDERLNRSAPAAEMIDLTRGLGRVVRDLLIGLWAEREHLSGTQFDAACDRLVELVCMAALGDNRVGSPDQMDAVESAVRRYVRDHAADPQLSGRDVAHALGWSLRQVQLVLQRAGTTPSELIREERLRLARERLTNPVYRDLTIGSLAGLCGFSSNRAFSTAFRQRYGMTPREFRGGALQQPAS
jgi:AraC-like DNA-binding protein